MAAVSDNPSSVGPSSPPSPTQLRGSGLGWAFAILLVFSVLSAWVLERGHGFYQPKRAKPEWKDAHWVGYPGGSDVLYLRRVVVLPESALRAALTVAGVDAFSVYVNGRRIGREEYIGARPSAAFDLSRLLNPGSNVVGILVKSSTKDTPAQALALLEWETAGAKETLRSDGGWRAESRQRLSSLGETRWSESTYSDDEWKHAELIANSDSSPRKLILPALPAQVVEHGPSGAFIWHGDREASTGGFERLLEIQDPYIRAGWIGVSVAGQFFLSVNDVVIGPISGSTRRMSVLEIGEYFQQGTNRVAIQVAGNERPMHMLVTGFVDGPSGAIDFSSDERWRRTPDGTSALVVGRLGTDEPALVMAENVPARNFYRQHVVYHLKRLAVIFAFVVVLGWAFVAILEERGSTTSRAWLLFVHPFAVASLVLALVRIADWDPRFSLDWVFPVFVPVFVFTLTTLWLLLLAGHDHLKARFQSLSKSRSNDTMEHGQ